MGAPEGRLRILRGKSGARIIDDTYNAGPRSMENALEVLGSFSAKRKVAILGDMLELGSQERSAHLQILQEASRDADVLIVMGKRMNEAAHRLGIRTFLLEDFTPEQEDVVLVKGSRGMRMEEIVRKMTLVR